HRLHTLITQTEHPSGLGLGGNLQCDVTFKGGHLDSAAQGGRGKTHGHLAAEVLTVTLENGVFLDGDLNIEVPRRTAIATRFALASKANAVAAVHTSGNLDGKFLAPADPPLAEAVIAGIP